MARKKNTLKNPIIMNVGWFLYADFMTLLFAFFVVMYAISSLNLGKYKVLSNSLNGAFGTAVVTSGVIRTLS